ncbi:hypothetical protein EJ02DRAFT_419025 [Clathrospora elynae]|uniref:RING-type domain-containing protein n=1 Tax=Clathrospora elynae TaxID=706981 RepID=A0A6A5T157_9PLEO|nr:hypothetical protein EJ02DRAFT_419025 [Clathrospora elynae]
MSNPNNNQDRGSSQEQAPRTSLQDQLSGNQNQEQPSGEQGQGQAQAQPYVPLDGARTPNATPAPSMPALRSQAEFFLTGVIPVAAQLAGSNCTICTEHLAEDVVQMAGCLHYFHTVCILAWLQGNEDMNRTCPNCRHTLYEATPAQVALRDGQPPPAPTAAIRTPAEEEARLRAGLNTFAEVSRSPDEFEDLLMGLVARGQGQARSEVVDMIARVDAMRVDAGYTWARLEREREREGIASNRRNAILESQGLAVRTPETTIARRRADAQFARSMHDNSAN